MSKVVNITKGIPIEYSVGIKTNKAGIRTNNGVLEFKNYNGIWMPAIQLIVYDDLVQATASTGENRVIIFVTEVETFYRYEPSGAGYIIDGQRVLATALGGDTRYIGVAGQYAYTSGGVAHVENVVRLQLNALDITNKYVEIPHVPTDANDVVVFVESGIIGAHQTDYDVSSNRIVWNGKEWDGVLAVGDILKIIYWHV